MKMLPEQEDPINLVKATRAAFNDPATRKKGAFARRDWDTGNETIITHAKVNQGWWAKSWAAQDREVAQVCGTYRVGSSPSARVKERDIRHARPWTLKDKAADAPADAILIKAADKLKKPQPSAPLAPRPRAASPRRRCEFEECDKELPYRARADAKFCCEAHRRASGRRKAERDIFERAFKDYKQSDDAKAEAAAMLAVYGLAADEMKGSAVRCGIEAAFVATGGNVVAIHDKPLPPLRALQYGHKETDREWLLGTMQTVEVQETRGNLTTSHPDVIALLESAGAAVDGPERSVTLFQFEIPAFDCVGIPWIELRFRGDPGTDWSDSYDPPEERPLSPRDVALMQLYEEARRREINAALKARRPAHVRDN